MPTIRHMRLHLEMHIDPNASRLQLSGHAFRALQVRTPNRRAEAEIGVVGASDDFFFVCPFEQRDDGPEGFLLHDARVVGRIVDDSWVYEVALTSFGIGAA